MGGLYDAATLHALVLVHAKLQFHVQVRCWCCAEALLLVMPHGIKLVPRCDLHRSKCMRFLGGPVGTLPPLGRALTHDALSIPSVIRHGAALSDPLSAVLHPMRASPRCWRCTHCRQCLARSSAPFPHVFVEAIITCRRKPTSWMICCGNLAQHGN